MSKGLGISMYLGQADISENIEYLSLAAHYGFSRVFTCLLSVSLDGGCELEDFKTVVQHARGLGMEVIADVSPSVLKDLGISYKELGFFSQLGLTGIRLDEGFSGLEEGIMSVNPYGLKLEINMSSSPKHLDSILAYVPNRDNIIGCHNFYPHRYTGLSRKHFISCSKHFKEIGIRTAAFVTSKAACFGPWKVTEGLCTLEEHRQLPIAVQAKDLFNTGLIDDVIIANAFASEEELKALSEINKDILTLSIEIMDGCSEVCKKIMLEELHFNRGDVSEYMIRSTQSRIKYKDTYIELFNPKHIKRGDILIESSLYDRYAGEMQIALKDMENSGKTNIVGRISEAELFLIDHVEPWQKFMLKAVR